MRNRPVVITLFALIALHLLFFGILKKKIFTGHTDFAAFYAAGKIIRNGSAGDLYQYETQKRVQAPLFTEVTERQGPLLYYHPPYEATLFAQLARLPYAWAFGVWTAGCLLILFLLPRLLGPQIAGLRAVAPGFVTLSFLSFFPAFIAVIQGQDSVLLALLFVLCFLALKRGDEALAGAVLALGLFKFQFVLPVAALFLIRRRWRFVAGFSGLAFILSAASLAVVGRKGMLDYPVFLWRLNDGLASKAVQNLRGILPFAMPNLRGLLFARRPDCCPSCG